MAVFGYEQDERAPLVQWRGVFGGAVVGIGVMILLATLWVAIGFGSSVNSVRGNLNWYLGGSAIFSVFLAGYLAGLFSGVRGMAAGFVNALTVWALVLIATIAVSVPAMLRILNVSVATSTTSSATVAILPSSTVWTTFWSIVIGLGAAIIGGTLGGLTPRRSAYYSQTETDMKPPMRETIVTREHRAS